MYIYTQCIYGIYTYMHYNFFIHSSTDGPLDRFPIQAFVNDAAVNTGL